VGGLDASGFEELPNELAAFCAVIFKGLAGPLPRDEDATAGDAEMFDLVGFGSSFRTVDEVVMLRPPHLVIRRRRDCSQLGPRDRAVDRRAQSSKLASRFDSRRPLHPPGQIRACTGC